MANRRFLQFFYTLHNYPVLLDCNFVVTPTNGAGVTSLVGPGISAVFMDTSTTPTGGNPDPAAGYIMVKLQDNYQKFYGFDWHIVPPVTGSEISISGSSVLTAGVPYVISTVGTSTAANWQTAGLPSTVSPAVGVPFVSLITGGGTGTGKVKAVGANPVMSIVPVADPNATLKSTGLGGGYLIFECQGPTNSSTTTPIATAPLTGSIVSLRLYMSNTKILAKGE